MAVSLLPEQGKQARVPPRRPLPIIQRTRSEVSKNKLQALKGRTCERRRLDNKAAALLHVINAFFLLILFLSIGCVSSLSFTTTSTPLRSPQLVDINDLRLPDPVLAPFMMDRNVTFRPNPNRNQLHPIQMYKGGSVAPNTKPPRLNDKDFVASLTGNLSQSSQFLLENYESLSAREQNQFRIKIAAETRASTRLDAAQSLHILYHDEHICVVCKPSGILSVPGPRRNPSLAGLVHDVLQPSISLDQMVVHRLDMDTSGIMVFALTELALKQLHSDFRERKVHKSYTALLTGHVFKTHEIDIDLFLERDPLHAPFMRIAHANTTNDTTTTEIESDAAQYPGFAKFINQAPKASWTDLAVKSLEYLTSNDDDDKDDDKDDDSRLPVTRVSLTPHTGRTHQLRVHTAALGFSIVGDDIYGYQGNGDCGVDAVILDTAFADRQRIQREIDALRKPLCLHAQQLCFFHPLTGAAMIFECDPVF